MAMDYSKYLYETKTQQEKQKSLNDYNLGVVEKLTGGYYDNPDNRKMADPDSLRNYYIYQQTGKTDHVGNYDPKYDDLPTYYGIDSKQWGNMSHDQRQGTISGKVSEEYKQPDYTYTGGGGGGSSFTPSQRQALTYGEASDRAKQQLDPLYERALENVYKQRYQNELNSSEVASKRGLSHSGLAADQMNKIGIATQSNVSDLDAQRAAKIAEMAQRMVEFDQNMALQERGQSLSEYLGVEGLNLNREQFDFGKFTNQRDFDYNKSRDLIGDQRFNQQFDYQKALDERNFGYQQSRDARRDAEWESEQKDSRAWRQYVFNNMSASEKAQLEWAKAQYGEEAAWRMYEMEYKGSMDQSMNQAMIDYYKNAGFNSAQEGGGYSNNYKTAQQSSKSSTFNTYQTHLQQAIKSGGIPASWAPALTELVGRESSWNPNAKNPKSTAHGYGQFLNSTRSNYEKKMGISYSNPVNQLIMMAQYVKDRYGTPEKALAFWDKNKWY